MAEKGTSGLSLRAPRFHRKNIKFSMEVLKAFIEERDNKSEKNDDYSDKGGKYSELLKENVFTGSDHNSYDDRI
ncbi:MAG: hypothetical protein PHU26_08340 [Methanofollis liminatans]|uniref:hypothetical protein n=1 Tax=Methanofollis liminatans TaxID=2201 RepID=UPI0012F64B29|nr:hypothetical protein [Methanofollis liminatans]MDD3112287.1 hypothetical protein [Methanofollis liminatans]